MEGIVAALFLALLLTLGIFAGYGIASLISDAYERHKGNRHKRLKRMAIYGRLLSYESEEPDPASD